MPLRLQRCENGELQELILRLATRDHVVSHFALTCYLRWCHGSSVQKLDFVFKIALVSEKVRAHCKVTVCDISSAIKLSSVISSAPIFLQLLMILKFNRLHHNNRNELLGHNDLLPGRYSCSQQVAISFRPVPI